MRGNDKDNARKTIRAAIALLRDVSAAPLNQEDANAALNQENADTAVSLAQARLGDLDAAIETLCASKTFNVQQTLDQILSELSQSGDVRALESLAKFIPDQADFDAAVKAQTNPHPYLPKDKAPRVVDIADHDATQFVGTFIYRKSSSILIFSTYMSNNRLDSYIALAEARLGNLDAALAKIDRMSNQFMRAATLRLMAEMVVEHLTRKRE